jgi:hypothetical protein
MMSMHLNLPYPYQKPTFILVTPEDKERKLWVVFDFVGTSASYATFEFEENVF